MKFAVVGAIGLAIDLGVLQLMVHWFTEEFATEGRIVSLLVTAVSVWALNGLWTFKDRRGQTIKQSFMAYMTVMAGGLSINFGVYWLLINLFDVFTSKPLLLFFPVAAGSAVAMVFNYLGAKKFAFKEG